MLENVKYNLGREYNFYATFPPAQRSKEGTAVAIRKEITHKILNIRTIIHTGGLHGWERKKYAQYIYHNRSSD